MNDIYEFCHIIRNCLVTDGHERGNHQRPYKCSWHRNCMVTNGHERSNHACSLCGEGDSRRHGQLAAESWTGQKLEAKS